MDCIALNLNTLWAQIYCNVMEFPTIESKIAHEMDTWICALKVAVLNDVSKSSPKAQRGRKPMSA